MEALRRLAEGAPVTSVTLDLGYATPSAFAYMFRRALGHPAQPVPPSSNRRGERRPSAAFGDRPPA